MGQGYQDRDYEIIDYQLYNVKGIPRAVRGPKPILLEKDRFFTCVGAAQTFGCYCEKPFPLSLQQRLNLSVLNLGVAGAGPSFFTTRPPFIKKINDAKFAIIQIMSGRSESNALFQSKGGEMLIRHSDGKSLGAAPAYRELLATRDIGLVYEVMLETRKNWVNNYIALLNEIKIPKILFWFSVRALDYSLSFDNVHKLFGEFPQFVTAEMVEVLTNYSDEYVECTTCRGLPQPLVSRFSGEHTTITKRKDLGGGEKKHNDYYPSPEMHDDATLLLESVCRKFL